MKTTSKSHVFGLPGLPAVTIFLILLIPAALFAQQADYAAESSMNYSYQTATLTPEQTLDVRSLSDVHLSPGARYAAFTVTEPVEGTRYNSSIWIYDMQNRELKQFTTSGKSDRSPHWSPDGTMLAFISNRYDRNQIYLIPIDGGEATALTECETGVQSFAWSPDGDKIAFMANEPKTDKEKQKEEDKDDAYSQDKDDRHSRLWTIDVESRDVQQITSGAWRLSGYAWTPGGDRLVIKATDHPKPELLTDRIFYIDASTGDMQQIYSPPGPAGSIRISPDGSNIAFTGSRTDGPTTFDLFVMPSSGGTPANISAQAANFSAGSYLWLDSDTILAQFATGFTTTFFTMTTDGQVEKQESLSVQPGSFDAADGVLAFIGSSATDAPELWIATGFGEAEKVSDFNSTWKDLKLVKPEILQYTSFDGVDIEASLLLPHGYIKGTRLPLVIHVHGGPSGRWMDRFNAWGQLLAARGFAVLCPNIRGSTGYSHEFMVMNRRDWGGADYKDVMAGVDHMIREGIADPERIGIGGWSYGGYMAAWAVTQTDRFKASVSGAPMTDLAVEYGSETSSINAYDTWYLGTPYENLDLFVERSPVTYVKNVTTPTLILCGENDATDPIEQCQQFYRGLKRYDVETEFVRYPREGHGIREEKHRIDVLNRMVGWFEKYLK